MARSFSAGNYLRDIIIQHPFNISTTLLSLPTHTHTLLCPLTLYPDLSAGTLRTWQQCKLFSLVHGVVCAGNYNLISRFPGLMHLILQVKHHLIHSIHLEARDWESWTKKKKSI